jgi:hypothetical protein
VAYSSLFAGKVSLGAGAVAQAVDVIMKEIQRIESDVFMQDPIQQIMNRGLH